MKTLLEQKNAAIERVQILSNEVKSLIEKVEAGTATADDLASVDTKSAEMKTAKADVERIESMIAVEKEVKANQALYNKPVNDIGGAVKPEAKAFGEQPQNQSNADVFLNSAAFKDVSDALVQYKGQLPKGYRVNTQPVEVKTLINSGVGSFGNAINQERLPGIDTTDFSRPLSLLSLVTRSQTSSNMVEFNVHSGFANAATNVGEATATTGASGAKPESGLGVVGLREAMVRTIAHYLPVTRQALQDLPSLRTIINQALTYGIQERLEAQILNGDGTGENMLGILNTPGVVALGAGSTPFHSLRIGIQEVAIDGRTMPTAIVMHPTDYMNLELDQNAQGDFYSGSPFRPNTFNANVWGYPVIQNETIAAGTALVGNFSFAYLWESLAPVILLSDSHADFFTRNLIALLGEMRAAFGLVRPSAFKVVTL